MTGVDIRFRYRLAIVVSALAAGCSPDRAIGDDLDVLLRDMACAREVGQSLRDWGADHRFFEAPPDAAGARSFRFPTGELGEWVVVTVPNGRPPRMAQVTAGQTLTRLYSVDCVANEELALHQPVSADRSTLFTDADLRAILDAADGPVVVYVWAPHMPLSVDGYAEIATAGRALGVTVVPLLMAYSDRDFARREAERAGIPEEGLRRIDSNELVQRDAQLHAPSIVVFGPDRVSPVLPGYRNRDGYRRFLEAFLRGG